MGAIRDLVTDEVFHLEVESLIGRAAGCSLRIHRSFISAQHAKLLWSGQGWEVRDLVSLNGTFVDERRLPPGGCVPLPRGTRIAFGAPTSPWELVDESPPDVLVTSLTATRQVVAQHRILAIPSCHDPHAMLYRNSEGRWFLEKENESITPISAMQTFELGADVWRFSCPLLATDGEAGPEPHAARLEHVQLHFLVSPREEPLRLQVMFGDRTIDLGAVSCGRLLLALARRRLLDHAHGLGEAAVGWMHEEDVTTEATLQGLALNAAVCRIRRQFDRAELLDPANIVARRPRMRQLRLGTDRIAISTFDSTGMARSP